MALRDGRRIRPGENVWGVGEVDSVVFPPFTSYGLQPILHLKATAHVNIEEMALKSITEAGFERVHVRMRHEVVRAGKPLRAMRLDPGPRRAQEAAKWLLVAQVAVHELGYVWEQGTYPPELC